MADTRPRIRLNAALTLIELMVCLTVIAILAAILLTVLTRGREAVRATQCMSNQRQVGFGLQFYWEQHRQLSPDDFPDVLRRSLGALLLDPNIFRCPEERQAGASDSYSPFYVGRAALQDPRIYVMGCPRHANQAPILFGDLHASLTRPGKALINGKAVAADAPPANRRIDSGMISFEDGSSVDVQKSKTGFGLSLIASFYRTGDPLYSLVRMDGEGKVKVEVTPGSAFETFSPSAVACVHGTKFTVETTEDTDTCSTEVKVTAGRVGVSDRSSRSANAWGKELAPGQSDKISKPKKK